MPGMNLLDLPASLPPTVLAWSKGLASLSTAQPPCPNFKPDEWRETHERCADFVTRFGEQADAMGWDTITLFGVHPKHGIIRGDWTGVLMPFWADMIEVTERWIKFGKVTAWKDEPVRYRGIPVWEFGT
ncbi:hypothetical protein OPKNFCMD_6668 [Methylobacterium crusticola]|uniref:Uncharacterized protein n=1 Tax=Methylobacterium crusticola TaxID=1697972 RepID=A0ABQ4R9V7_9HYPH|nr:hypothetical protein [Methylobacterium crusticola]GJD53889.1 hypothetical protein OPKNFCMD_6668 [Methylobacterium crusticola]